MGVEDLAYIEDTIHRAVQRKTSPRWDQDRHSHEAIKEAIDQVLGLYPPRPQTKVWYVSSITGSDITGNGGEGGPYASITKACTEAYDRDTIIAIGGFDEAVVPTNSSLRLLGLGPSLSAFLQSGAKTPFTLTTLSSIEIAGFRLEMDHITVPGFNLDQSMYCHIHDNLIFGSMSNGIIATCTTPSRHIIERNRIYGSTVQGILVSGVAAQFPEGMVVRDNYVVDCDIGISLFGGAGGQLRDCLVDNNKIWNSATYGIVQSGTITRSLICENTIVGSGTADFSGYLGHFVNNKFNHITAGTHTTAGAAEETIFSVLGIQPMTRLHGYLRLNNMIAGDSFTFRVKKSYDNGVTWDIIDETNLVGVQTIARYDYDLFLEGFGEQARVTVQRIGGVDRAFYHKRTEADK